MEASSSSSNGRKEIISLDYTLDFNASHHDPLELVAATVGGSTLATNFPADSVISQSSRHLIKRVLRMIKEQREAATKHEATANPKAKVDSGIDGNQGNLKEEMRVVTLSELEHKLKMESEGKSESNAGNQERAKQLLETLRMQSMAAALKKEFDGCEIKKGEEPDSNGETPGAGKPEPQTDTRATDGVQGTTHQSGELDTPVRVQSEPSANGPVSGGRLARWAGYWKPHSGNLLAWPRGIGGRGMYVWPEWANLKARTLAAAYYFMFGFGFAASMFVWLALYLATKICKEDGDFMVCEFYFAEKR